MGLSVLGGYFIYSCDHSGVSHCPLYGVSLVTRPTASPQRSVLGRAVCLVTRLVRSREVVRISEGPLREVLLYTQLLVIAK